MKRIIPYVGRINGLKSKKIWVTVDSIKNIENGLRITGWFPVKKIKKLIITNANGVALDFTSEKLERQDASAAIGAPAQGFRLRVQASNISDIRLIAVDKSRKKINVPLPEAEEPALDIDNLSPADISLDKEIQGQEIQDKEIQDKEITDSCSKKIWVTVDSVKKTDDGLSITGWYPVDKIKKLGITDVYGAELNFRSDQLERQDASAAIGAPAEGFRLQVQASNISDIRLIAIDSNSTEMNVPLPEVEEPAIDTGNTISESISQDKIKMHGNCENVIVSDDLCFIAGWIDRPGRDFSLEIVDEHNNIVADNSKILRFERKDVVEVLGERVGNAGFISLLARIPNTQITAESTIRIKNKHACTTLKLRELHQATNDRSVNLKRVLNIWRSSDTEHLNSPDVVLPIVQAIYPNEMTAEIERHDFGNQPEQPKATIIIPLYGRCDFMRYQMSCFNRTQDVNLYEIIYVVDDPKLHQRSMKLATDISTVMSHHFSVALLSNNVGFGKANNLGASIAKANKLILLNSDILPKTPGWADKLIYTLDDSENTGAVGARLLFEDGSIQHDGMLPMTVAEYPGLYFNDHPYKGWPVSLSPNPAEQAECPLLTAACLAMRKDDYNAVGGFTPDYILGDFEDSDLCFKLLQRGKRNVIRRDVELYHLERQSQNLVEPGQWKHNLTILNAVTYNQRWSGKIEEIYGAGELA